MEILSLLYNHEWIVLSDCLEVQVRVLELPSSPRVQPILQSIARLSPRLSLARRAGPGHSHNFWKIGFCGDAPNSDGRDVVGCRCLMFVFENAQVNIAPTCTLLWPTLVNLCTEPAEPKPPAPWSTTGGHQGDSGHLLWLPRHQGNTPHQ